MKILILGGDGYLGWPTAMSFAAAGHDITVADNFLRRRIMQQTDSSPLLIPLALPERVELFNNLFNTSIKVHIGDLCDKSFMDSIFADGGFDAVVHYAEQPSAPYSMIGFDEANMTLQNNISVTFNLIWAVKQYCPSCHIVKLGTMGEYGTPNIDIEEGYITINHKGRSEKFLYPRQAGSLYHTTKILDTDLLWFYVRMNNLRVTDLMQGPVYGMRTPEISADPRLATFFSYDDIFGTLVNRFIIQVVADIPLTVYGKGGQTRGYLNINDTIACVSLAVHNPPPAGEMCIYNQFTETFSVNDLALLVQQAGKNVGLDVHIQNLPNPRKEKEEHYYNPAHSALIALGHTPTVMTHALLEEMLHYALEHRQNICSSRIAPRVKW